METNEKKILIVDDEKYIVLVTKFNLQKAGYNVLIARGGEEAIQITPKEQPDLILLDIMMPVVDGFKVLDFLKSNDSTKKIPVVILSSRGGEDDKEKAFEKGANDYLLKPFSVKQLMDKVNSYFK
jgi:two-component system, OmpR family, alkaline phosphatase synthesis response regulator PhoP